MLKKIMILFMMAGFILTFPLMSIQGFSQDDILNLDNDAYSKQRQQDDLEAEQQALSQRIYDELSPESQAQVIEESNHVYEYCNKRDLFASFHDCECVASKFFDARLLNPDLTISIITIGDRVAKECPNIPGVAGFAYEECHKSYGFKLKVGLEDFCQCYAKNYALFYEKDPRAVRAHMSNLGSKAMIECDATGMASPLNPDRF